MWQSVEILNVFSTLTLKQIFWQTKNFFKKLEYRFLVESTKIENASFSYKTTILEANIKTKKCWVQNRPTTKNGVLPVTTLFFWKFCFSLRTFYKELIWCTNNPNAQIRTFCKCWSFIWRCFFPVIIFNALDTIINAINEWFDKRGYANYKNNEGLFLSAINHEKLEAWIKNEATKAYQSVM